MSLHPFSLNSIFFQNQTCYYSLIRYIHNKVECVIKFSNKDTKWVSQVFRRNKWKDGSKLFDLEKDDGFRLLVPQRDFPPGAQIGNRVAEGMETSRRVIFIISRYP